MARELQILQEALSLPKYLFHGTSYTQLMNIKKKKWIVDDLYLADMESKSWDYAEIQDQRDHSGTILIVLEVKSHKHSILE